jgi:hypothetical protein
MEPSALTKWQSANPAVLSETMENRSYLMDWRWLGRLAEGLPKCHVRSDGLSSPYSLSFR